MKTCIILISLLILISKVSSLGNDNCNWIYKCCKLVNNKCEEMCEPEVVCTENEDEDLEFSPFSVINVKCRFGFKTDPKGNCRRVLK